MSEQPFGMIEIALRELIMRFDTDATESHVDNAPSYDPATQDFFYWIALIPGSTSGEIEGRWTVDIDILDTNYGSAMRRALALEPALLRRGGHRTNEMLIDSVFQNEGPAERPWEDDGTYRVGATYVFTARRPG